MRIYCPNYAYNYYVEYINSIIKPNDEIYLFNNKSKRHIIKIIKNNVTSYPSKYDSINAVISDNVTNIMIGEVIPILNLKQTENKIKIIYINTEQLTSSYRKCRFLEIINKLRLLPSHVNVMIYDYSEQNIEIIQRENLCDVMHLPYQYNENEINKLKSFIQENKNIANGTCICGNRSTYRDEIIKQTNSKIISNVWRDTRDIEMSKSKILLNLHCFADTNIYESIRCDRWIFAGHLVMSEYTINNDLIDLKDFIVFKDRSVLHKKVQTVLDYYDNYIKVYDEKKDLLQSIINKRKNKYDEFRKNVNN